MDTERDYSEAEMLMCWQSLGTGLKSHSSTGECSGYVFCFETKLKHQFAALFV